MEQHELVNILMVEDDALDVEAFQRSLKKNKIINPLVVAHDGVEALDILRGDASKSIQEPLLIMMDINMPRMSGIECLREIRNDPKLKDHIVFIMTTSSDEGDRYDAYDLNVAGYMVKRDLGSSFIKAVEMLDKYCNAIVFPRDLVLSAC